MGSNLKWIGMEINTQPDCIEVHIPVTKCRKSNRSRKGSSRQYCPKQGSPKFCWEVHKRYQHFICLEAVHPAIFCRFVFAKARRHTTELQMDQSNKSRPIVDATVAFVDQEQDMKLTK